MSPLTVTSVASAAIISGDLIIGLSDGSIINCGRVQGPQGLDGPAGPIGAPGRPGQDGNTILTSEGLPRPDVGTNGDYIIDKVSWTIYGPKANGVWGIGTPLRGNGKGVNQKRDLADGVPTTGDGEGGGGVGKVYTTSNLPLSGTGKSGRITAPGGNIIPEGAGLRFQSNLNKWVNDSLSALDKALPIGKVDTLPDEGQYEGDMVLHEGGLLWIWNEGEWIEVGGAVDTKDFATKVYANKVAAQFASVPGTQADWINQTYSSGTWILQTGGAPNPELQRFIVTAEDFQPDTSDLSKAKYVSVHAYGGGAIIHYQYEKPGDTLQTRQPAEWRRGWHFGIYEIEDITEHNFPDDPRC